MIVLISTSNSDSGHFLMMMIMMIPKVGGCVSADSHTACFAPRLSHVFFVGYVGGGFVLPCSSHDDEYTHTHTQSTGK